jgi:hypothetical protein
MTPTLFNGSHSKTKHKATIELEGMDAFTSSKKSWADQVKDELSFGSEDGKEMIREIRIREGHAKKSQKLVERVGLPSQLTRRF